MSLVTLAIYLVALPFSVWLLANCLSLLDQRPVTPPLIRLLSSILGIALFLMFTHRDHLTPILFAFGTVFFLHAVSGWALRRTLGSPSYESSTGKLEPPRLDELAEQEEDDVLVEK